MESSITLRFVLMFAVLSRWFLTVDSLYCYVCTSREEKTCGYKFMMTQDDTAHLKWCTTSCYKLSTKRGDREVVSRGCLPDMKTIDWCRHDRKGDVRGVMCTCNKNYCNATSGLRPNFRVLVLTLWAFFCGHVLRNRIL